MTNILYFSTINRDAGSATSSARTETSEPPQTAAQASPSAYKVIGKAWRAFARPQLQADNEENDYSTTAACSAPEGNKSITKPLLTYAKPTPPRRFSYRELKTATSGFHSSRELGSSESGSVFKGWINEETRTATEAGNGIAVAVKRIYQGSPLWVKEVGYLGRFNHPYLVRTIGYCIEGRQRILVYEFMPRRSLNDHLFDSRFILVGIGSEHSIDWFGSLSEDLHDYSPKLSFGANGRGSFEEIETPYGPYPQPDAYNAPDWPFVGENGAGDVYSFGAVLLEILVGRKMIPSELRFVLKGGEDEIISLLDRSLPKDQYGKRDAQEAAGLVILCLRQYPRYRETMDLVVKCLTRLMNDVMKL